MGAEIRVNGVFDGFQNDIDRWITYGTQSTNTYSVQAVDSRQPFSAELDNAREPDLLNAVRAGSVRAPGVRRLQRKNGSTQEGRRVIGRATKPCTSEVSDNCETPERPMSQIDTASAARRIAAGNMYMTIATADTDGRPWVSPVWFAPRSDTEVLWVSSPNARHSRNIAVRPAIAIVIFDSTVPIGGAEALYLEAVADEVSRGDLDEAIATFSARSQRHGAHAWAPADVLPPSPLRLYRATAGPQFVLGPGDERLPVQLG